MSHPFQTSRDVKQNLLCDYCGRSKASAEERGSTHCNPPFEVRQHAWTGKHPANQPGGAYPMEVQSTVACSLGVGCDETGVCYAQAHGRPEMCGVNIVDVMPPSPELGTDPHMIRRNGGPISSEIAANSVDTASGEAKVLEIISEFGDTGCILDELKTVFRKRYGLDEQYVNRRTGLHQKGRVLRTQVLKKGESGQPQHLYVARHLIEDKWVVWLKENYGWLNPCLFGPGEQVPLNPDSTKAIVRDLLEELVSANLEIMMEGGVYTSSIGESLDHEDSAIGRACAYLKRAIPVVPPHGESPW